MYQPGPGRLRALDFMRLSCISSLMKDLEEADSVVRRFNVLRHHANLEHLADGINVVDDSVDADLEAISSWQNVSGAILMGAGGASEDALMTSGEGKASEPLLNGTTTSKTNRLANKNNNERASSASTTLVLTEEETEKLNQAQALILEAREYLPQLIAALLHSTSALTPVADPKREFRGMLLRRCLDDPNMGIELCWLLEAEVGRAWKTLFEHKDRTGRRLILVLPNDKARAVAKIGSEKRYAFDLLQDAEMATAFGYVPTANEYYHQQGVGNRFEPRTTQLPASVSELRCNYFGDCMHFVDRLTQISLDLRMVPVLQRKAHMEDRLRDINRRIRRRMLTNGLTSLDVDDGLGPDDFPQISDIKMDMLRHSVHFPLEPKIVTWPSGDSADVNTNAASSEKVTTHSFSAPKLTGRAEGGSVRVLNILSSECRLLSSRERCPFLVHLEVADSGMEGSDALLYGASGRTGLTLTEGIGLGLGFGSVRSSQPDKKFFPYSLPGELCTKDLSSILSKYEKTSASAASEHEKSFVNEIVSPHGVAFVRGGWQSDGYWPTGDSYNPEYTDLIYPNNPYEQYQQQELQQMHQYQQQQQQQQQQQNVASTHYQGSGPILNHPMLLMRSALLDHIYGQEWSRKCMQIRLASPFGKVKGWRLASFIMKAGEDIRKEALVMQVISKLDGWFKTEMPAIRRPILRPYTIMCVGEDAGLLECLSDAKSIDEVKKECPAFTTLRNYFERAYGPPQRRQPQPPPQHAQPYFYNSQPQQHAQPPPPPPPTANNEGSVVSFEQAQDNFLRSLVGYSLVSYILQIKDRHNANILLDRTGTMVHIDFGFVLGETPKMGKVPIFSERAPFKLTPEFWDILGGWNVKEGGMGCKFCSIFEAAFACASKHSEEIASLIEAAYLNLARSRRQARFLGDGVRERLRMRGPPGSPAQKEFIMELVNTALTSWGTSTYDWLQKTMNGYE